MSSSLVSVSPEIDVDSSSFIDFLLISSSSSSFPAAPPIATTNSGGAGPATPTTTANVASADVKTTANNDETSVPSNRIENGNPKIAPFERELMWTENIGGYDSIYLTLKYAQELGHYQSKSIQKTKFLQAANLHAEKILWQEPEDQKQPNLNQNLSKKTTTKKNSTKPTKNLRFKLRRKSLSCPEERVPETHTNKPKGILLTRNNTRIFRNNSHLDDQCKTNSNTKNITTKLHESCYNDIFLRNKNRSITHKNSFGHIGRNSRSFTSEILSSNTINTITTIPQALMKDVSFDSGSWVVAPEMVREKLNFEDYRGEMEMVSNLTGNDYHNFGTGFERDDSCFDLK